MTTVSLALTFGAEQTPFIDMVVNDMVSVGHIQHMTKTIEDDKALYEMEFSHPYYIYVFGHRQATMANPTNIHRTLLGFSEGNPF